ncbi:MAG TPA: hypothetical protein VJ571_06880, partial [Candidatus Nitrosotalea sp.]|nr:hypothetical protein [Candidatus Nitrosotalea sp.]
VKDIGFMIDLYQAHRIYLTNPKKLRSSLMGVSGMGVIRVTRNRAQMQNIGKIKYLKIEKGGCTLLGIYMQITGKYLNFGSIR